MAPWAQRGTAPTSLPSSVYWCEGSSGDTPPAERSFGFKMIVGRSAAKVAALSVLVMRSALSSAVCALRLCADPQRVTASARSRVGRSRLTLAKGKRDHYATNLLSHDFN